MELRKGFTPPPLLSTKDNTPSPLSRKSDGGFTLIEYEHSKSVRRNESFTLIELLIAISILAVAIVGVLAMFPTASRVAKSSQMISIANYLGQEKMEEESSRPYGEISVGIATESYEEISDFKAYKRITEINYYDPLNSTTTDKDLGIKKIEITVFWKSPLGIGEKSINIKNLITKR